jgi:hypothetical protein
MIVNEFRWSVTPPLPGQWHETIDHGGFRVQITQDWIEARCDDAGQQDIQKARAEEIIQDVVRSIGFTEKTRFTAILGSTSRLDNEANRRDTTVYTLGASLRLASGHADVIVTSAGGAVLRDSRAERFAELLAFAESIAANEFLQRMTHYLSEYHADLDGKLAPLYDIIELVREVFVTEKDAATALSISKSRFEKARKLMNNSAVRSGRHRGQELGAQRDPAPAETALCEAVAEQIVSGYAQLVRRGSAPR